jgi:single-stranded-DNA-specific exonuclease
MSPTSRWPAHGGAGWQAQPIDEARVSALAAEIGVRRLTAAILLGRGLGDSARALRFLAPRLADLRRPEGMADLERTLERLAHALAHGERIAIFGDYDVDGVTTAAVLASALRALGGDVIARVANRRAGYGVGPDDVARFADEGCRLLVTGDCGTTDHEALALARARGLDAVVIDHHQVPSGESAAFALINPHRPDDRFPFKGLASCGVAFYLAGALRTRLAVDAGRFDPRDLLDLVALGTVADLVPLIDENRILVAAGLRIASSRKRCGLRALAALAGIEPEEPITAEHVSFRLAPRLNAAGRLGEAQLALDLLLAPDDATADRLAAELDECNRQRQMIQEQVWTEALSACEPHETDAALVVGAEGWHPGVVGLVAAKLVERYARPAIVIGFEAGQGRGSARTVPGFNLYEALAACAPHLSRYGGHAAAAGMSLHVGRLEAFRQAFVREAALRLGNATRPPLVVDAVVELHELDLNAAEELGRLAPFGAANAQPIFALPGVTAESTRLVGQGHLMLTLRHRGATGDAIAFGMADRDPGQGACVDLVACAELDTFRGNRRARLKVKHLYRRHES